MNCRTCNIAAPQYELFDGLCGKCLLAAHQRTLVELEATQKTIVQLRASMKLIGERISRTKPLTDFLNASKLTPEIVEAWKEVYSSGIRAQMQAECDAREWYVSKEKVKPLARAAFAMQIFCETHPFEIRDVPDPVWVPFTQAIDHARSLGLLEEPLTQDEKRGEVKAC